MSRQKLCEGARSVAVLLRADVGRSSRRPRMLTESQSCSNEGELSNLFDVSAGRELLNLGEWGTHPPQLLSVKVGTRSSRIFCSCA